MNLTVSDPIVELARREAGNTNASSVSEEEREAICQSLCKFMKEEGPKLINRDNDDFCTPCTTLPTEPPMG